jgi:hypothetical protein
MLIAGDQNQPITDTLAGSSAGLSRQAWDISGSPRIRSQFQKKQILDNDFFQLLVPKSGPCAVPSGGLSSILQESSEELCPGIVFRDKFHPVPYDKRQDEIARPFNLVAHYYRKCQLCPHPWS